MKVREIMTKAVRCAAPDTTLDQVARMMRDEDVGAIPVLDDDILCGIITDRDIVLRCVAEEDDPTEVTAEDIITGDLRTINPDADLQEASHIMAEEQIRRLPVCDNGRLIGMISIGDIAVKAPDEHIAGETLENVSEGVKATAPGQRSGSRKPATASVTGPESAGVVAGGRQQTLEQEAGRQGSEASNMRGRARPSRGTGTVEEGAMNRSIDTGRSQGISNRAPSEEQGRQSKVVPIRGDQQAAKKAQQDTKKSGQRRATSNASQREGSMQHGKSGPASQHPRSDRKRRAS